MLSDPKVWGDPENFRPERFLMDLLPNPLTVTFGYGMRVCAGMHLADRTGFHIGATIAALYDVAPLEGKRRPKPELAEFTDTFIRCVDVVVHVYGSSDKCVQVACWF